MIDILTEEENKRAIWTTLLRPHGKIHIFRIHENDFEIVLRYDNKSRKYTLESTYLNLNKEISTGHKNIQYALSFDEAEEIAIKLIGEAIESKMSEITTLSNDYFINLQKLVEQDKLS